MPRSKHSRARTARDTTQIPRTIQRSDPHARHIWKKAHDSAVKTYGEGQRAHRVAYAALKHSYEKRGDRWVPKGGRGPSDPRAARGFREAGDLPTAGGKVARTPAEARRKARQARREYAEAYRRERPRRARARRKPAGRRKAA